MNNWRLQTACGLVVGAAGVASMAGLLPAIADFSYPIVWWGVLVAVDAVNLRRWGQSPFRRDWPHLLALTVPLSALYWLIFEFLNLRFPQWQYRGNIEGTATRMAFGFVSYATVIPILAQFHWLFAGPAGGWPIPRNLAQWRGWFLLAGLLLLLAPVVSDFFWLNQGMWIAPALLLLPFLPAAGNPSGPSPGRFAATVLLAGLVSGFLWELFNYWSPTGWEYLVYPDWPHLFAMPLHGYLGFLPFAVSTLAVYRWHLRFRPAWTTALGLYAASAIAFLLYVRAYEASGMFLRR